MNKKSSKEQELHLCRHCGEQEFLQGVVVLPDSTNPTKQGWVWFCTKCQTAEVTQ
jgi:hypothetical protein